MVLLPAPGSARTTALPFALEVALLLYRQKEVADLPCLVNEAVGRVKEIIAERLVRLLEICNQLLELGGWFLN